MTVGQGDVSGGEGPKKPARKLEGCEEESGDQASEETSTKRDEEEILNPSTAASSSLTPSLPTSAPNPSGPPANLQSNTSPPAVPQNQDQHHFLRSSVRPPSKRLRKDPVAPALNGHSGAKAKGESRRGRENGHLPTCSPLLFLLLGMHESWLIFNLWGIVFSPLSIRHVYVFCENPCIGGCM